MYHIETGIVVENNNSYASIKPLDHSKCNDCGACKSASIKVLAYNSVHAKTGEMVRFKQHKTGMIKIAFILFFFPLISIFLGVFVGNKVALSLQIKPDLFVALGAILFLSVSIVFIVFYDRKFKLKLKNIAEIIEIVK